jgi:hypothetical protein
MNELTAKINEDQLQEAIDKAALKGAIEVINDYYTGYNRMLKFLKNTLIKIDNNTLKK